MSRTGRPKSDNPKSYTISVRLDTKYAELLDKYASKAGMSKANVIRKTVEAFLDKEEK